MTAVVVIVRPECDRRVPPQLSEEVMDSETNQPKHEMRRLGGVKE
jgi:hypothetical protein